MTDFQKALGILSKAKQGSLFGKPVRILGTTRRLGRPQGKTIDDKRHTPESFISHHKDWLPEDHESAIGLHKLAGHNAMRSLSSAQTNADSTPKQRAFIHRQMSFHRDIARIHRYAHYRKYMDQGRPEDSRRPMNPKDQIWSDAHNISPQ